MLLTNLLQKINLTIVTFSVQVFHEYKHYQYIKQCSFKAPFFCSFPFFKLIQLFDSCLQSVYVLTIRLTRQLCKYSFIMYSMYIIVRVYYVYMQSHYVLGTKKEEWILCSHNSWLIADGILSVDKGAIAPLVYGPELLLSASDQPLFLTLNFFREN